MTARWETGYVARSSSEREGGTASAHEKGVRGLYMPHTLDPTSMPLNFSNLWCASEYLIYGVEGYLWPSSCVSGDLSRCSLEETWNSWASMSTTTRSDHTLSLLSYILLHLFSMGSRMIPQRSLNACGRLWLFHACRKYSIPSFLWQTLTVVIFLPENWN